MSETPPYYRPSGPAPKKNSNTVLIVVLVCVVLIPCIGLIALAFAGFSFVKNQVAPMAGCILTLETAKTAMKDYVKEKGTYPKAATWQDDIRTYYAAELASKKDKYGPFPPSGADEVWSCKFGEPTTGIAYNDEISGKKPADIKDPSLVIMFFEVDKPARNAHAVYKNRPESEAPKFMGTARGWMKMPVDGDITGIKNNGSVKIGD